MYFVPNLERALTIMLLLKEFLEGLSLIELKSEFGFPNSSIF